MQTHYWGCRVQSPHDLWTQYEIEKPLANAEGGEGGIFTLKPHAGEKRVAKLYNPASKALLNPEAFRSLAFLTSKYAEFSHANALPFVAWPIEVLFTVKHPSSIQHLPTLAGITMRHISGHTVLEKLTTNGNGRFGLGTEKSVRIAAIIANYLSRLHKHGIVFCDFNPKNILVSNDHSNVTFVDADAFQHSIIPNVFTKPHYFPGYASPDHIDAKPGPRQAADDNFVLAIHIFQLLLDGGHPFDTGPAYNPSGDPFATITPHDNIKARRWPYSDISKYHPPGETPKHYARLHPELRALFERAFVKFNPPTAAEWDVILPKYRANVEGSASPPPPKPPVNVQTPSAPGTAAKQPAPHNTPSAPQKAAPYTYQATLGVPSPAPASTPASASAPPPRTARKRSLTAKELAKVFAWWLAENLWRLFKAIVIWLLKQLRLLVIAAAKGFRRHGGIEATAGLIFLALMFWFFRQYETNATANAVPAPPVITEAPQPSPVVSRPVATTKEPAPVRAKPAPEKKTSPAKPPPEPETEVLPWLVEKQSTNTPPPQTNEVYPYVKNIYGENGAADRRRREAERDPKAKHENWNDRVKRRQRELRRADNSGWTDRGRSSEFRLVPGATPILRFTPSQ
jgi:serine/threonine protein kinase